MAKSIILLLINPGFQAFERIRALKGGLHTEGIKLVHGVNLILVFISLNHKAVSWSVVDGVLHAIQLDGNSVCPSALNFREDVNDGHNSCLQVNQAHVRVCEKSVSSDLAAESIGNEVDRAWPLDLNGT